MLEQALQSHRQAASLNHDNADVIFNTGQVLVSLAEAIEGDDLRSLQCLEESLRLFHDCFTKQEALLAQSVTMESSQADPSDEVEDEGGVLLDSSVDDSHEGNDSEVDMQWASVVEPTTSASLAETCTAALDALAVLFSTISLEQSETLGTLLELSAGWMQKLDNNVADVEDLDIHDDARCSMLKCQSAAAEATFRFGRCDIATYSQRIKEVIELTRKRLAEVSAVVMSLLNFLDWQ